MKKWRRALFGTLLATALALNIGWLLYFPYTPGRLFHAIPAEAQWVSYHADIAGRWDTLATNPVLRAVAEASGIASNFAASIRGGGFKRLVSRETIVARVPAMGRSPEPAWIAASWIGGYSPILRWAWTWSPPPGLVRQQGSSYYPVWNSRRPTQSGEVLSLAFAEGVVLACLSKDPDAVRSIMAAYDGVSPSAADATSPRANGPFAADGANLPSLKRMEAEFGAAPDRGWFLIPPGEGDSSPARTAAYALNFPARPPRRIADGSGPPSPFAVIRITPALPAQLPLTNTMETPLFERFWGDIPAIVMALPASSVSTLLSSRRAPAWSSGALPILTTAVESNSPLVAAVLMGEYGGGMGSGFFRAKVPTLLVGLKLRPDSPPPSDSSRDRGRRIGGGQAHELMERSLDRLNALYRMGLILDPVGTSAGDQRIYAVEPTIAGALSQTEPGDRPAYTVLNNWLILSSNARSLAQLANRTPTASLQSGPPDGGLQSTSNAPDTRAPPWTKVLGRERVTSFAWVNREAGGKALQQLAMFLLTLSIHSPPSPASEPTQRGLRALDAALAAWKHDGALSVWMESDPEATTIRFAVEP